MYVFRAGDLAFPLHHVDLAVFVLDGLGDEAEGVVLAPVLGLGRENGVTLRSMLRRVKTTSLGSFCIFGARGLV